jgi:hypothetical protein
MNPEPFQIDVLRYSREMNWMIISLIVLALAYIAVRFIYSKYWKRYRQALFLNQDAMKLMQEKNVFLFQAAAALNALAALSIGLFLSFLIDKYQVIDKMPGGFAGWIIVSIAVFIAIGIKYLINNFLGTAGDNNNASAQINHQWLINLKNFGFFILPVTAAAAFIAPPLDKALIAAGLALMGLMLIMNYIKGFLILFQHHISIYYGILYLCTLEILPVLIIWKVIVI